MKKSTNEYESVKKYTDAELLEMWLRGWSADELAKMLHREDKKIRIKDARMRIDKITTRWNFENQGLPVPEMWK